MYFLIFFALFLGVFFKVSADKPIDLNQGIYAPKQTSKVKKSNNNFVMKPRQLGHDSRFKSFSYTPNVTFEIVALYDNSSYIEFEQDETITTIVNPKKLAWQLVPAGNRLFIKPEESDANTSITIFTNKRRYFFEFSAKEPTETFDPDHTFFFQFKYPTDEDAKNIRNYAKSILPDVDQSPWKYNFNYTITGEDSLYPVKIFDDGEFTYFEFPKSSKAPAVFSVDSNGFESIVNFRIVGEYLVVEEVSGKFTLRNGADVVCIFNESMYAPKKSRRTVKRRDYSPEIEAYNGEGREKDDMLYYEK